MPLYSWRTVAATNPAINVVVKYLEANILRVSLIVTNIDSSAAREAIVLMTGVSIAFQFAYVAHNDTLVLPYRDYGPVIREAIYVSPRSAQNSFSLTEVCLIPEP